MTQIEIDLEKLERGTHTGQVKVTRGGKTFYRKQRVGQKKPEKSMGTFLKIKAKSGADIPITVSGTQDNPIIKADGSFMMGGKKVTGNANIQHWKSKGAEEGLFFQQPKVYIQCAADISKVKDAISNLPSDVYMAKKVDATIDADGHKISTGKWQFDKIMETEGGTLIPDWHMADFLDKKGIDEIEIADAVKMWADEKEAKYLSRNIEGDKRAKVMFESDVAEVGYQQACENAGIPKNLR